MLTVYPDYYKKFRCIADKCKHNCCIGWEIDIDPETTKFYSIVKGDIGNRIRSSVSLEPEPHFILTKDERCPFLNQRNLCDIITELGEEHICDICSEHPRFHNELGDRIESGLGLCCEAAAAIILGQTEPAKLEYSGLPPQNDEIITLRDKIFFILQNREKAIEHRIDEMLSVCNTALPESSIEQWANFLLSLERLDDEWTQLLALLINTYEKVDIEAFNSFMAQRQTEYEQLTVYFIYRHFSNAFDVMDAASRAVFAAFGYKIIHALGAVIWQQSGDFSFEQQVNIARLFSSEIEYSDENLYILLDRFS